MLTEVTTIPSGRKQEYATDPRSAVLAAYAQNEAGDWNTWDYETKYGRFVREGDRTFHAYNEVTNRAYCAFKEARPL